MSAHSIALLGAEVKVSCCRGAAVPVTAALLQNYSSFSGCSSAEVCIIPEARSWAVTISGGGGDLLGTVLVSRHPQHCPSSSPSLSRQTRSSFSVLIIALLLQTLPLLPNNFENVKATKSYFQNVKYKFCMISSFSPFKLRQLMLISFLWLTISNPGHIGETDLNIVAELQSGLWNIYRLCRL